MDMRETSAMMEASGLMNEGGIDPGPGGGRRPLRSPSQDFARSSADRLRKVTVKAPLQSLFVAFLLGIWIARRR